MNINNDTMSHIEVNKAIIQRYFEAYNNKNEEMIASEAYPDLVGTYWKGSLTPKVTTADTLQSSKIINYRGVSIHRIQNGKMVETWHVVEGWPLEYNKRE